MIGLTIINDGDGCWPDLIDMKVHHVANGSPPLQVAVLEAGLASGRPSVSIRIDLPDGSVVVAETSARLFCAAGRAIAARFPDLFVGE